MAKAHRSAATTANNDQQVGRSVSNPTASSDVRTPLTGEMVARRAYEIFLARGSTHGRDQEDWLQAERELRLGRQ